jgi:hypothetical protein
MYRISCILYLLFNTFFIGKSLSYPLLGKTKTLVLLLSTAAEQSFAKPQTKCFTNLQSHSEKTFRGGKVSLASKHAYYELTEDQRAVLGRIIKSFTLLGRFNLFVACARLVLVVLDEIVMIHRHPKINVNLVNLIGLLIPKVLPNFADIGLAKVYLNCASVLNGTDTYRQRESQIKCSNQAKREEEEEDGDDDISKLMKAIGLLEIELKGNIPPTIMKTVASVIVLVTYTFQKANYILLSHK